MKGSSRTCTTVAQLPCGQFRLPPLPSPLLFSTLAGNGTLHNLQMRQLQTAMCADMYTDSHLVRSNTTAGTEKEEGTPSTHRFIKKPQTSRNVWLVACSIGSTRAPGIHVTKKGGTRYEPACTYLRMKSCQSAAKSTVQALCDTGKPWCRSNTCGRGWVPGCGAQSTVMLAQMHVGRRRVRDSVSHKVQVHGRDRRFQPCQPSTPVRTYPPRHMGFLRAMRYERMVVF